MSSESLKKEKYLIYLEWMMGFLIALLFVSILINFNFSSQSGHLFQNKLQKNNIFCLEQAQSC